MQGAYATVKVFDVSRWTSDHQGARRRAQVHSFTGVYTKASIRYKVRSTRSIWWYSLPMVTRLRPRPRRSPPKFVHKAVDSILHHACPRMYADLSWRMHQNRTVTMRRPWIMCVRSSLLSEYHFGYRVVGWSRGRPPSCTCVSKTNLGTISCCVLIINECNDWKWTKQGNSCPFGAHYSGRYVRGGVPHSNAFNVCTCCSQERGATYCQ